MSRPRLPEGEARSESRNGRCVGIALFPGERALLLRAIRQLVEREGESRTATDVETMLASAVPVDVLRELERDDSGPS